MPGNFKKEDLRIIKTHKALLDSFTKLLEKRNFLRLTVNDICEEAQLSRAAFYTHFHDKYAFLSYWLASMKEEFVATPNDFNYIRKKINEYLKKNCRIVINLLENANNETLDILRDFATSFINISKDKLLDREGKIKSSYIVISNFWAGGIIETLRWQIQKRYPLDFDETINDVFYSILEYLRNMK